MGLAVSWIARHAETRLFKGSATLDRAVMNAGRRSVRRWTIYAIDVLARREQIPPSVLVDRVLTAYARRHRVKVACPAPRGVAGPGNGA